MSTIATALKHMLAAGMPHEAIVAAVAEMEAAMPAAVDPVAERRRAYDRERKRNIKRNSTGNPPEPVENAESAETAPHPLPPKDNNSNPPTPAPENTTPRAKAEAHVAAWWGWRVKHPFPRPYWADPQVWTDFLAVRKRKDMVNTLTAHKRLLRDIDAAVARTGWPPGRIFEACVEQGWGAIYDTDEMKAAINGKGNGGNRRGSGAGRSGGHDNRDGFARELDEQIARHRGAAAGRSGAGEDGAAGRGALAAPAAVR